MHPQTARRVHAASRQLGYIPNAFARGLRTRTTRSIGVILPDFTNPVYARVISGIERRAGESAISVVVRALHDGDLDRHADLAWESRVDGLLFGALSQGSNAIVQLEEAGVPCVLINRTSPEAKASVVLDEAAGVRLGLEYLIGFGHRRIAFVSGPGGMDTARRRRVGFVEAGAALGLASRRAADRRGGRSRGGAGRGRGAARARPGPDRRLRLDDAHGARRPARIA